MSRHVICSISFLILAALLLFTPVDMESIAGVTPLLAQEQPPELQPPELPAAEKPEPQEVKPEETRKRPKGVAKAPQTSPNTVSFFFDDADIFDVVQTVFGDVLKVNYIIDPRVKGKVNFRTVNPIPREEVLPIMEIILRMNGIGFVEERGLYNIIPLTEAPKELAFAQIGKEPEKVTIELFTFKNLTIKDSMAELESALGMGLDSGKIRVIPIYRLNAIMVMTSSKDQMDYIRRWVEKFDTIFAYARPKVTVYPLQNSKATHVASMLQSILGGGGGGTAAPTTTAPAAARPAATGTPAAATPSAPAPRAGPAATVTAGSGFLVLPETKIFADEITNSLVILATPSDYAFIEETIRKIDVVQRQVVIEALIARVDLTDNLSFGVAWSLNTDVNISGMKLFKKDINLKGDVINMPAGTNLDSAAGSGFSFIATDPTGIVRAKLTAALKDSRAKILAAPHILVSDNREARIQVGQQIPLSTSTTSTPLVGTTTTTTSTVTSTIQYKDIGIILKVKPQVNDSGLVSLEISQEVSSVGDTAKIADQEFSSINKTEATTNLVAQDGETIIIGGLIREDTTKSKDGIPFLSKIPIIGSLFSNTTDNSTRSELIILLTPRVIKNMGDAGAVTSDYVDKYKTGAKDKEIEKFIEERGKEKK